MLDGKQIRQKLIGSDDERAVSPVIGVILMVAITVILAAVIAAFVLDLGQGQSASPSAAFQFEEDGGDVKVTLISEDRVDSSPNYQFASGHTCTGGIGSVGSTCTISSWGGDKITITAQYQGETGVVATYSG